MPSRHITVLGGALLLAAGATLAVGSSTDRHVEFGFWFETIGEETTNTLPERFGTGILHEEMKRIESVAFEEVVQAFREFPVTVSRERGSRYRVRVVENLRNVMVPWAPAPSGESRAVPGFGGQGAVNFRLIAHTAIAFSPPDAERGEMIAAIGRGLGRTAVHEFAHQLLGSAPIHDSKDDRSYEYGVAARPAQYYGEMHWDIAGPTLRKRFDLD
jgi:hypothetical protein